MTDASKIREHMEVIGADGVHVGTVDCVKGTHIMLTKSDSPQTKEGQGARHHAIPLGLVAAALLVGAIVAQRRLKL